MKVLFSLIAVIICQGLMAQQQADTRETYHYSMQKTSGQIMIDGQQNEAEWQDIPSIKALRNHWPLDTGFADALTEVKMTYDSDFVYVTAICYDDGERVIQTLRRDNEDAHWSSDNFTFVLDPMNGKQNGFLFGVNAGGAQIEALLSIDGVDSEADPNWDNKWYSSVQQYPDRWVVEMAIPFKTLRYSSDNGQWGINFIRGDMQRNSYSTWTQFPLNYGGINLNFMGTLDWDAKPKQAEGKVVLIPYLAGGTNRDFENEEGNTNYNQDFDGGLDAKIAITGSMNLDLTLNPDFSNVDVDQQVTNLSRFSIFFPERRNFFLENGDIFSNFGAWQVQPFFSRRIGLNGGRQVPILYGARLTGNVNENLRAGFMNVQTRQQGETEANNYTVAAVHQRVLKRSILKAIVLNRQTTGTETTDYARNAGVEFQYVHPGGKWNNTFRFHGAMTEEKLNKNFYYGFGGRYRGRHLRMGWTLDVIGQNFITELGFNPRINNFNAITEETTRQGYTRINPWTLYRFIPKKSDSRLNQHGPRTWHNAWLNPDGSLNERRHGIAYDFIFKNTSEIRLNRVFSETNLPVPTNLIGADTPLPVENYKYTQYFVEYNSDNRKILNTTWRAGYGDFFNGTRLNVSSGINVRAQPWGTFGINYDLNKVELAEGFGETTLHLLRANAEISFSNTMFWTTAVQYNSQAENYNIFSRFQWRYRPMSDFFLVYTDNYTTDGLNIKNRQIVFKITYWLNT